MMNAAKASAQAPLLKDIARLSVLNGRAKSMGPLPERHIRIVGKPGALRYHAVDARLIERALG